MGMWYADEQWKMPRNTKHKAEYQALLDKNLSWQTRYWIDDMFMISCIQVQAYLVTKDRKYIDRAAAEMVTYLNKIQRPNGLFYHAEDAPFFWGRGNGWMAAGMTELLSSLPQDNPNYSRIMESYRKMMKTLQEYQKEDGLWGQLIDDKTSWSETSGSAMFTYALIKGVKKGWLDEATQHFQMACNMDPANGEYRQALMMMRQGGQAYRPYGYGGGMDTCDLCTACMCLNCLCGGCGGY